MERNFLEVLCNFYMVVLAVLLPLYTEGSYWQLGDTKYVLFRNLSALCLGLALCGGLAEAVGKFGIHGRAAVAGEKPPAGHRQLSLTDISVLSYGVSVVLSALCSSYGATAWVGYREWYMGAFSQLLFVGIYFFVSRQYGGATYPVYLWEAAFFLAVGLGLCNRFGLDPLGLKEGWNTSDWEYSHMLSTLGNINWFCGYCSVALALPMAGYLESNSRRRCICLYLVSLLGLVLLCIQGSDSGLGIAAVCLATGFIWGQRDDTVFARVLLLAGGMFCSLPVYGRLAKRLGDRAVLSLPVDGIGLSRILWNGWWVAGILCLAWYTAGKLPGFSAEKGRYWWRKFPLLVLACGVLGGLLVYGSSLLAAGAGAMADTVKGGVVNARWGSGRGGLWELALKGFLQGGWKQKLLGAGPDCFADYIYGNFPAGDMIIAEGRWAGAVFANAHNQWLNHLVNLGLLGVCSAMAIAVAAARRYRRCLLVLLALVMYGFNSLVSFQQVLSTPMFFLVLGMGENYIRRENSAPTCAARTGGETDG